MALVMSRDPLHRRPLNVDLTSSSQVTRYTYAQATYFLSKFGNNSVNPEWLKVFSDNDVPASIADNPLHQVLMKYMADVVRNKQTKTEIN